MANRAIRYRIYPTAGQAVLFAKTFGCCRKVYNLMLADKISFCEKTGSFGRQTPAQYKKDYSYGWKHRFLRHTWLEKPPDK